MKSYIIKINGKYFEGECNETIDSKHGLTNGFHNTNNTINKIAIGNNPKIIQGNRNLKSYIDKIFRDCEIEELIITSV